MPEVRESETGKDRMAGEESILHESFCEFCRQEMPEHDNKGCGEGIKD